MACRTWCDYTGEIPTKDDPESLLEDWVVNVSDLSNYLVKKMNEHVFLGQTFNAPTQYWLACHSAVSNEITPGEELSGGGYGRLQVQFEQGETDRKVVNTNNLTSLIATADWEPVYSLTLWDAAVGGNYLTYGNLTAAFYIKTNKAFYIPSGSLTVEFLA